MTVHAALAQSGPVNERIKAQAQELNQRGTADIRAGRIEEASALFLRAIQLDPKLSDAYENLTLLFLLEGDDAKADGWAVRLLSFQPDSYHGGFVAGIAAINQHRFLRARTFLSRIVGRDSSDPLAIAALAMVLKKSGDRAAAARLEKEMSGVIIESHDVLLACQIFRENELKNTAEKWLETAIHSGGTPSTSDMLYTLATIYEDDGRNDDAASLYRKVLTTSPNNINALVELSELERKQGDDQQSLAHLYTAKTLAAGDNTTLIHFSQVCVRRHMYVDARDALQKVVAGDPHNREAWYQLGLAQYRIGEADAAANDFKEALTLAPDDEWSRIGLGAVLSAVGHQQQATAEFARVLTGDPRSGAAYYYLARIHRDEGKLSLALGELQLAVKYAGNDARPLAALGQLEIILHNFPSARRSLEKAIQVDPASATAHYTLAMLLRSAGKSQEAKNEIALYKKYHDEEDKQGIVGLVRQGEWDYPGFMPLN
jgi:tetratricopeptide (TPR) repeat protein